MVQAAVTGGSVEFVFRTWPARPDQLRRIRAEVRGWLATLRRLSERAAEDIVVVVSEAASNTVEHAYDADTPHATVEVTFWTEPGAICIEVVDHGRWRPPDRAGGGRGFLMMHRLVDAVVIRYGRHVGVGQPNRRIPSGPVGGARGLPVVCAVLIGGHDDA